MSATMAHLPSGVELSGTAGRAPVGRDARASGRRGAPPSDGRPLWLELARRLPSPHELAPLLLFGWSAWRAGDAAVAGMAADRALAVDPGYSAADLLLAAVTSGMNPHTMPRLRRSA